MLRSTFGGRFSVLVGAWRGVGRGAGLLDLPADGGTIVTLVAMQEIDSGHPVKQTVGGGEAGNLTIGQQEGERPTGRIAQSVDFSGSSATGPSDGLASLPPLQLARR